MTPARGVLGIGEQARAQPDAIAFDGTESRLTYEQLDRRADALARHLLAEVAPASPPGETFVVYAGPRDERFAVAALGILAAGFCVLLVDHDWPAGRLEELHRAVEVAAVVGSPEGIAANAVPSATSIPLGGWGRWDRDSGHTAIHPPSPAQAAYAACTTGTSGAPKVVVTSHGALAASIGHTIEALGLSSSDRTLQFTPLGVDICLEEMLSTWSAGGTVVEDERASSSDIQSFTDFVARRAVSVLNLPAAFWRTWREIIEASPLDHRLPSLRAVGVGSDAVQAADVAAWLSLGLPGAVFDLYGSTEQAITSAINGPLDLGSALSEGELGRTAASMSAQVLRPDLSSCDPAETGELVVAGPSIASYYHGNSRLTADRFRPSPFGGHGMRMYRSGDKAVRLRDGSLRLLGRLDRRVKVRSFSVDLDEVEAVLAAVAGVEGVRVSAIEDSNGDMGLSASIDRRAGVAIDDLKARLASEAERLLPDQARPRTVIVDGEPAAAGRDGAAVPADIGTGPRAAAEALWREMLGVSRTDLDESFVDLGGHSLLVARFLTALRYRCQTVIDPEEFLERPTLRRVLDAAAASGESRAEPAAAPLEASGAHIGPATRGQTAMWMENRRAPQSPAYNVPLLCTVEGEIDAATLRALVASVADNHPGLRTAVFPRGATVVQEHRATRFEIVELRSAASAASVLRSIPEALASLLDAPFDLGAGEVARGGLVRCAGDHDVLAFAFHHVAIDEQSLDIFLRALQQAAAGREAEAGPNLIDVAQAVEQTPTPDALDVVVRRVGELPWRSAPWPDRPGGEEWPVATVRMPVASGMRAAVEQLAQRSGGTVYAVACATFGLTLARFLGQEDVVIGVPVTQRDEQTSEVIGPLLNTMALRISCQHDPRVVDVIARATHDLGFMQRHSDIALAEVASALRRPGTPRQAVIQAMVLPEPEQLASIALGPARVLPRITDQRGATMDITLIPRSWQSDWEWDLVYRAHSYTPALVHELGASLLSTIERAAADPERRASEAHEAASHEGRHADGLVVLDGYGRALPQGAIGWLHRVLATGDEREVQPGRTRRIALDGNERSVINTGKRGRVSANGGVELLCDDGRERDGVSREHLEPTDPTRIESGGEHHERRTTHERRRPLFEHQR